MSGQSVLEELLRTLQRWLLVLGGFLLGAGAAYWFLYGACG